MCALNKALFPKGGRPLGEYSTLRFPEVFFYQARFVVFAVGRAV